MIDKSNKLWKWSTPNKETRDWYKKTYGLEMKEFGMMTNEGFDRFFKRLTLNDDGSDEYIVPDNMKVYRGDFGKKKEFMGEAKNVYKESHEE